MANASYNDSLAKYFCALPSYLHFIYHFQNTSLLYTIPSMLGSYNAPSRSDYNYRLETLV